MKTHRKEDHMKQKLLLFIATLALCSAAWAQAPQWERDANKLTHTIATLNTLLDVNPFIDDVPGLETAIGNKVSKVIEDLDALKSTIETEIGSLSSDEKSDALATLAQLLLKIADAGERLNIRALYSLSLTLGTNYNYSYYAYYTLANQYSIGSRILPIGVILADRSRFSIPG
jgi:hypothetical protein